MSERLPALATVNEVVAACRLCKATIWKLVKTGELRSVLLCGRRLIYVDSYVAWLERNGSETGETMGEYEDAETPRG